MRSFGGDVSNWAGNQRCEPRTIHLPESAAEIAEIVSEAVERPTTVKAIGAGHSFTPAAMTDGELVRLDRLDHVTDVDDRTGVVTVGAGITLRRLNAALADIGRGLPNLGDIDRQSLAGATATATHGTGVGFGNLSSGIVGFELVTGTGERLWCDRGRNGGAWAAARVGLGALGIVTRIAIETVPAFNLRSIETPEPLDELLADWSGFVHSAEHPEFFWLPGTRRALVKRNDRTTATPTRMASVTAAAEKLVVENIALGVAMRVTRQFPTSGPRISKLMGKVVTTSERVDRSDRVFTTPRHVRFVEMEYGIPIDAVPEALRRVRDLVDSMSRPPSFPVEVRVSAADDIPLSTAQGRETGWIAVHQYKGIEYEPYFHGVESIMVDYDGRPHWGKMHYRTAAELAPLYPHWDRFQTLRGRLDPHGVFSNRYLDRVLGPVQPDRADRN